MKTEDILKYDDIIKSLIDNATDINSLIKFKLLGMLKQFETEVQNFEKIRGELISKYGSTDDEGRIGIFTPIKENYDSDEEFNKAVKDYEDSVNKFNEELNVILESDSTTKINKFKAEDIMNAGIPADYLIALYDLIEE